MVKEEQADCMYVLYSGRVAIYTDKECSYNAFATECAPNFVFGEKALMEQGK